MPFRSLLIAWFSLVFLCAVPERRARAEDPPSVPAITGRLETKGELRILSLWGTEEQRGYAEGYLLAKDILELFDGFILHPSNLPAPGLWNLAILPMVKRSVVVSDATRTRIGAILAGMEARLGGDALVVEKIGRRMQPEDFIATLALPDWLGFMCSSFVVSGELIEKGEGPIVGRNLDYYSSPSLLDGFLVRVEAPGDAKAGWVSFSYPGMLGCLTGFSDECVSLAIHDVPGSVRSSTQYTPRIEAFGRLIETLRPGDHVAEDAAEFLRRFRFGFGGNLMLGWHGTGGAGGAVFEIDSNAALENGVSVRGYGDHPFVVCSNHHRLRAPPSECNRFQTLERGCELTASLEADPLSFDSAWQLLCKASVEMTLYRCLADLATGRLRLENRLSSGGFSGTQDLNFRDMIRAAQSLALATR